MPLNLELIPVGFFLTTETKQNYIVGRVRFVLVWKVRPVQHWNYVEPGVVFWFFANNTWIISLNKRELLIIKICQALKLLLFGILVIVGNKVQLNHKKLVVIDNLSQPLMNIPHRFFGVAIGQMSSVRSQDFTIFVNCFFTGIFFDQLLTFFLLFVLFWNLAFFCYLKFKFWLEIGVPKKFLFVFIVI